VGRAARPTGLYEQMSADRPAQVGVVSDVPASAMRRADWATGAIADHRLLVIRGTVRALSGPRALALPGLRPIQSLHPHQHLQEVITEGHKKFAPGRRITGARANGLSRPIRG